MGFNSLQGQLLLAQPQATGTVFEKSVVLVCEHTANGSWGIILNKNSQTVRFKDIAKACNIKSENMIPAFVGGPVQADSIHFVHTPDVVHSNTWFATNSICVTSSIELMGEIEEKRGPAYWRLCSGVAAWQPGQLEGEMSGQKPWTPQHRWLTVPCPADILKIIPSKMWEIMIQESVSNSVNDIFS